MGKKFAVFDIDGTLLRWQLYHAVADQLAAFGHFDTKKFEAVRKARAQWKKRDSEDSFREYEKKLVELVDGSIKGLKVETLNHASQTVIEEYKDQVYTYTRDLIKSLKRRGYLLFALSASQIQIVELMAQYYGFDDFGGSVYEVIDGRFTGKKEVLKSRRKPEYLGNLVKKHNATYEGSIAVGDSESDIPMLKAVENPIAFNPTRALFEQASKRGWKIVVERKNVVYKLEQKDGSYVLG